MDEIDPKEIDRRFKVGGCKAGVTDAITAEVALHEESRDGTWWAAPLQGRAELYRGLTASFHVEASEADLAEVYFRTCWGHSCALEAKIRAGSRGGSRS